MELNRERMVEQRAQRIALQTNSDVKMVEEQLMAKQGIQSRFDSVIVQPQSYFIQGGGYK